MGVRCRTKTHCPPAPPGLSCSSRASEEVPMQTDTATATSATPDRPDQTQTPAAYDDVTRMLIGGVWRPGRSGKVVADRDPYSGETLVEIALADIRDVEDAYET